VEFVINLKTAKAFHLTVRSGVRAIADESWTCVTHTLPPQMT
jgi:hypothetical protein